MDRLWAFLDSQSVLEDSSSLTSLLRSPKESRPTLSSTSYMTQNRKVIKEQNLAKKWAETKCGKKLATQERRAKLNDFERFQVMVLKRQVSCWMRLILL